MLLVTSAVAQEDCTPIEPRKWEGTPTVGNGWIGVTWFEQNGCTWAGAEGLNGLDTIVWDVSGYGGLTAAVLGKQANDSVHRALKGAFLNDRCQRISYWGMTEPLVPYSVTIPEEAQWVMIIQEYGGFNTEVTMETSGRQCEEVVTPTKPSRKQKRG